MAMQPRPSGETFRPCLPRLRSCLTPSFTAHGLYRTWMTLGLPGPSVPVLAPGVEVRQHERHDQQCTKGVADRRREPDHRIHTRAIARGTCEENVCKSDDTQGGTE